ncbi:hypothetical protein [Sphingobacterium siyangense]|uniref:hypothetical protein n=1 Tax=Sphingobacterium siyangense TaxID=459529 RepID=UPI0031F7A1B2
MERIPDKLEIPTKKRISVSSYPKIEFDISKEEIQSLLDKKILDDNLNFATDITTKLTDPLSKLLYATSWKNGDLKKVKHIIKGIVDSENENSDQDDALVFYQFGKYLTKVVGQPIIDQQVIRAYGIYTSIDNGEVEKLRKLEALDKTHKTIINDYKTWLTSKNLKRELKNEKDYTYYIDKLLFATGKTIKFRKPRNTNSSLA